MTILELIDKVQELVPSAEIEQDDDTGEIIIRTGVKIRSGELVELSVGTKDEDNT